MGDSTFVPNSTGKLRKVLLCAPTYFDFRPINEITRKVLAERRAAGPRRGAARARGVRGGVPLGRRRGGADRAGSGPAVHGVRARLRRLPGRGRAHRQLQGAGAPGRGTALRAQGARARPAGHRQGLARRLRGRRLLVPGRGDDRPRRRRPLHLGGGAQRREHPRAARLHGRRRAAAEQEPAPGHGVQHRGAGRRRLRHGADAGLLPAHAQEAPVRACRRGQRGRVQAPLQHPGPRQRQSTDFCGEHER